MKMTNSLKDFLNAKVDLYNQPSFISTDPICVPHLFRHKQDIEIAGFFAAIFAWGNRVTIIQKSKLLMECMDMRPHSFCLHLDSSKLQKLTEFRHRTFNATDLLYFIEFFHFHYTHHDSLESAFTMHGDNMKDMLTGFHHYFFSLEHIPARTRKHIPTPERNSSCKRLNMYLQWMLRKDEKGVDFGIWKNISPSELICPLDIHVARVARQLKLLQRKQTDWLAAVELTENLRQLDKKDPCKYDLALFGMGALEKFG